MGLWEDGRTRRRAGPKAGIRAEERGCGRRNWDGDHGNAWPAPGGAAGQKGAVGVVVGNETRVEDLIPGMSQGHELKPGYLVLGGM